MLIRRWDFWLIDCQIGNPHLTRMGAQDIPRDQFIELIERNADQPTRDGPWTLDEFPPESWEKQN